MPSGGRRRRSAIGGALLLLLLASCRGTSPDPDNELPIGIVDTPRAGEVLRPGPTLVGGWAVDDAGIAHIRIYFDGRFVTSTTLTVARPDVTLAQPRYARGSDLHGWNVSVDFAATAGAHVILAQAVDTSGATRDIGVIPVTGPR